MKKLRKIIQRQKAGKSARQDPTQAQLSENLGGGMGKWVREAKRRQTRKGSTAKQVRKQTNPGIGKFVRKATTKSPHMAAPGATQPKPKTYKSTGTPTFSNPKKRKTPWGA